MQRLRYIAITALSLLVANVASAQDAAADASESANGTTPPKLVQAVQPVYPEAKLASGVSATVALVLTLDDTGQVTEVEVASSAGEDFDQAASDAAKQLKFEPATRDGKPVASRVPFRFQFEAPAPPAPAPVTPPPPARPHSDPHSRPTPPSEADSLDISVEGERP